VSDIPDTLVLERHRDLEGIGRGGVWWRRGVVAVIAAVAILALFDVFGQRPSTATVSAAAATLSVYAPTAIRGGDFMEARFHITAKRDLRKAQLVLDPGWAEGLNMNTIEPSPIGQGSDDGRLVFTLGHIPKGKSYILFMEFQVNPTNVAWHRPQNVDLLDGSQLLAHVNRSITIFP
jgi:hypothetical protein